MGILSIAIWSGVFGLQKAESVIYLHNWLNCLLGHVLQHAPRIEELKVACWYFFTILCSGAPQFGIWLSVKISLNELAFWVRSEMDLPLCCGLNWSPSLSYAFTFV